MNDDIRIRQYVDFITSFLNNKEVDEPYNIYYLFRSANYLIDTHRDLIIRFYQYISKYPNREIVDKLSIHPTTYIYHKLEELKNKLGL